MTEAVTLHYLYYLIDTFAWLDQRTGAHDPRLSSQLQDFVGCDVFDDYASRMDTAARMRLWCAAHGWQVAEGAPIEHDDRCLTKPITIVLAATTGFPRNALALVSVDNGAPRVYADVTTDKGYWLTSSTIQISCPGGHAWTWDGEGDPYTADAADGTEHHITAVCRPSRNVISRCRECAAFDDGVTDDLCPCAGYTIYCPTCDQRCQVALPEIPTYVETR